MHRDLHSAPSFELITHVVAMHMHNDKCQSAACRLQVSPFQSYEKRRQTQPRPSHSRALKEATVPSTALREGVKAALC